MLPHNLDVMHIKKNICHGIIGTISARLDLQHLEMWKTHWLQEYKKEKGSYKKYPAPWTLIRKENKIKLCKFLANVKLSDGHVGNLTTYVDVQSGKLHGLKMHHYHILLQTILPVGVRGIVPKEVHEAIALLGRFFKELCAKTLRIDVVKPLGLDIPKILFKIEKIFPPAFFDVIMHLVVHLPDEALLSGPIQYGWIFLVERRLGYRKSIVCNKARPEGSIVEAYIGDECLIFCFIYLIEEDIEIRFHKPERDISKNDKKDTRQESRK